MTRTRFWGRVGLVLAAAVLVAACTSGDDSASDDTASDSTEAAPETPTATGPAPGVTDDAIRVGITYVDDAALQAVGLDYEFGDTEAAYQALVDDINDAGGIHGRQLELFFAPIDPTGPTPAEEKCVQLTEDEDVFVVVGFFLADAVVCPVSTHETAVVGGEMTPERLQQAAAPWITATPDTDLPVAALQAYSEQGALDGNVAVFVNARDQAVLDDQVLPTLEELGVEPVEVGVVDAPAEDQPALAANVQTIAERFEAAGADTVVLVGPSGQDWPANMADDPSYRPELLFLDAQAGRAFSLNAATTDTSVLEGSLAAGIYGPSQAAYELPAMQECIGRLADRGIDTPEPDSVGGGPNNMPFAASFSACSDLTLLQAWLEAAGEDLNYGTLQAALDAGFDVTIPGDPTERHYGPPPDADGDPPAYLFEWDTEAEDFALIEE
jgi:Periplasmic binding protein